MPIGFDEFDGRTSGRTSGLNNQPTSQRPEATDAGDTPVVVPTSRPQLTITIWETFYTAHDERVCPVCGPYDGASWPQGEGLYPPLHYYCRCQRVPSFVTYESREE